MAVVGEVWMNKDVEITGCKRGCVVHVGYAEDNAAQEECMGGSQGCTRGAALVGDGSQEECGLGRVSRSSGSPRGAVQIRDGMPGKQPGCMGIPKRCCLGQEGVPEGHGLERGHDRAQEVPCGSGMTHGEQCMSGKLHWGAQDMPCGSRKTDKEAA